MREQLVDTGFPAQLFPVGSVATGRTVFGTVTELRLHAASVSVDRDRPVARTLRRAPAHQAVVSVNA